MGRVLSCSHLCPTSPEVAVGFWGQTAPFVQVRGSRMNITYKFKKTGPHMGSPKRCVCRRTVPPRAVTVVGGLVAVSLRSFCFEPQMEGTQ